jgi:hypothetical protein
LRCDEHSTSRKAYLETAPSACYKQNSGYYLTDDTPFLYFAQPVIA